MSFLRLNGFRVPVRVNTAGRSSTFVGGAPKRSYRSALIDRRRDRLLPLRFVAPCLSREEADTLEGIVRGLGHRWSFDADFWSFDGVGPDAGGTASIIAGGARFGAGYASITSITFDPWDPLPPLWTVMVWRRPGGGGSWVHYSIRSDGAVFVDGVRDDTADVQWLTIEQGAIGLDGAPDHFDDLVVLRFEACDRFLTEVYAWQNSESRAWSNLPELEIDGDVLAGFRFNAHGNVGAQRGVQFGGRPPAQTTATQMWRNNGRDVPFSLLPRPTAERIPVDVLELGGFVWWGRFGGTVTLDPDGSSFNRTAASDEDILIQRIDENGSIDWTVRLEETSGGVDANTAWCVGTRGGLTLVAASTQGTINIRTPDDTGVQASFSLPGSSTIATAVFTLDSDGLIVDGPELWDWDGVAAASDFNQPRDVVVDRAGQYGIVFGIYRWASTSSPDAEPASGITHPDTSGASFNSAQFVIRYLLSGLVAQEASWDFDRVKTGQMILNPQGISRLNLDGDYAVAGIARLSNTAGDALNVDEDGPNEFTFPIATGVSNSVDQGLVVKRKLDGEPEAGIKESAGSNSINSRLWIPAISDAGDVYVAGGTDNDATPRERDRAPTLLSSSISLATNRHIVVHGFNSDMSEKWTKRIDWSAATGLSNSRSYCLVSPTGIYVYLVIAWDVGAAGNLTFGPGEAGQQVIAVAGADEGIVAAFDASDGTFLAARHIALSGGALVTVRRGYCYRSTGRILVPAQGNVTIGGTVDFGDGFTLTRPLVGDPTIQEAVWELSFDGSTFTTESLRRILTGTTTIAAGQLNGSSYGF